MRKTSAFLSMLLIFGSVMHTCAYAGAFTPGTYEGTASSVGGPLTVSVTVDEDSIVSVDVTEIHDSEGVWNVPAERIPAQIVENQTLNVDTVTGATLTSIMIKSAVKDALSQAGDVSGLNESAPWAADAQEDMEADVVVIGGGIGGMSAAATTAFGGLKTVVLEKNAYIGGNAVISDQYCLTGVTEPVTGNWKPMVEDLNEMGIGAGLTEYPGYGEDTLLTMPDEDHSVMFQLIDGLRQTVEEHDGMILTDTPAIGLLSEDGKVTGVVAKPRGQEPFEIRAKAVILATGGFSSNKEMVEKYLPYAKGAQCAGLGSNTGDALPWVEELDGRLIDLDAPVSSFYAFSPTLGYYGEFAFLTIHYIDLDGKLITDDTQYNTGSMKTFEAIGNTQFYTVISAAEIEQMGSQKEFDHMELAGTAVKYDSLEALAEGCELPEFLATAEELGLEDGAYYACRAYSKIYGTYGGVAVDEAGHALKNDDSVLEGLYACGEVTGSRDFQLTGAYAGGLGPALTTGHVTGQTVLGETETAAEAPAEEKEEGTGLAALLENFSEEELAVIVRFLEQLKDALAK